MNERPTIQNRPEQAYRGVGAVTTMAGLQQRIPALTDESFSRLHADGLQPSGPPFLRYLVIDMPDRVEVELGIPVAEGAERGTEATRTLPGGRYAVLEYVGVDNGVAANKTLIEWIAQQGEVIASHETAEGQAFDARYETFLTDPADEPDRTTWRTEVAIRVEG